MRIEYCPFSKVWVSSGRFIGRSFVVEAASPWEAFHETVKLLAERR